MPARGSYGKGSVESFRTWSAESSHGQVKVDEATHPYDPKCWVLFASFIYFLIGDYQYLPAESNIVVQIKNVNLLNIG